MIKCTNCNDTGEVKVTIRRATGTIVYRTDFCTECCEHGEYDHGICLLCDKDCTDDLIGQAEDHYEGDR